MITLKYCTAEIPEIALKVQLQDEAYHEAVERLRVRENDTSVIASVRGLPTTIFVTVVNKIRQYFSQKSRFFQLDRQNPSILRSTEGLEI